MGVVCFLRDIRISDNEIEDQLSSFEGLVSTSNHLVPGENTVWIKTSKAIWWTAELKGIT